MLAANSTEQSMKIKLLVTLENAATSCPNFFKIAVGFET
jgi:hypothetical protein